MQDISPASYDLVEVKSTQTDGQFDRLIVVEIHYCVVMALDADR